MKSISISKNNTVTSYLQPTNQVADKAATHGTSKTLNTQLQRVRDQFPEHVAIIERFIQEHGFKSLDCGVAKAESSTIPAGRASQASPPQAPAADVVDGIVNPTNAERHVLSVMKEACAARGSAVQRIEGITKSLKAAMAYMDSAMGMSGAQGRRAVRRALDYIAYGGKGFAVIRGGDARWGREDLDDKFNENLTRIKQAETSGDEPTPPKAEKDGFRANLHPKTPRGFVYAARDMFAHAGDDYDRTAMAVRNGLVAAANMVAERNRASKSELQAAMHAFYYDSESMSSEDGPSFILSTKAFERKGEKAIRAEYERFVTRATEAIRPEVQKNLETEAATRVNPDVWATWVQIAGRQPDLTCQAVRTAEVALARTLDSGAAAIRKQQRVDKLEKLATAFAAADVTPLHAARTIDSVTRREMNSAFSVKQAKSLEASHAALKAEVTKRLSAAYGVEVSEIDFSIQPRSGEDYSHFVRGLIERAKASGKTYSASFEDWRIVVFPDDTSKAVLERSDDKTTHAGLNALLSAMQTFDGYTEEQVARAEFAQRSNTTPVAPAATLDVVPLNLAIRNLDDAKNILAYADVLAKRGVDRETVRRLQNAASRYCDDEPERVKPGTEVAWTLALEKLMRQMPVRC